MKKRYLLFLLTFIPFFVTAQLKTEMRAVWLTTNSGLDWPSFAYQDSDDINKQQDEMIDILDKLEDANINTVFIQVRSNGTVIYNSDIEPISSYIAGVENTWSNYDPLKFIIRECHLRGMECHAWLVIYKAGSEADFPKETFDKTYEMVKRQGNNFWFDPGHPKTNPYLLSLIEEVVKGYDVDGIHLDYVRYNENMTDDFDSTNFKKHGKGKRKADWRRDNINQFVYSVYDLVKRQKPWVQVSAAGAPYYKKLDTKRSHWLAYDQVFQDAEDWMKKGKLDFLVPMTYNKGELFDLAIKDWFKRSSDRYIVPGLGVYFLDENERGGNWPLKDVLHQINYSRENGMGGNAFFRAKHFLSNTKGLYNEVQKNLYTYPALLPKTVWSQVVHPIPAPLRPKLRITGEYIYVYWDKLQDTPVNKVYYNIYRSKTSPVDISDPKNLVKIRLDGSSCFLPYEDKAYYYVITAYDRYHNESPASRETYFRVNK